MKSLTKAEIIKLAKKHGMHDEAGLPGFVADVLNAAMVGETPATSLRTDSIAGQFSMVPTVTLYLQHNTLAGLSSAIGALAENADRKNRGENFCNLTSGEEITCLRALASVAAESSRKLAAIARIEAGALQ